MINIKFLIKIKKKIKKNNFLILIFLPLSFFILIFIILIRPIKKIKIGTLVGHRLGNFIGDSEIYLSSKNLLSKQDLILFLIGRPVSNKFVAILVKRNFIVLPYFILFPIYYVLKKNEKIKFFNVHLFNIGHFERDLNHVLRKSSVNLSLTKEEKDRGQSFLRSLGIMREDKFVCLVNRESNYLKNLELVNFDYKGNAFRNTDIENYKLACEEILKKGYYIFRMGRDVTPANINHDKFIDYANSKFVSDFLDIFLGSECEFAFGDTDGWIWVPMAFRKPMAITNFVPAGKAYLHSENLIYLFKHYYDSKTKRNLNLNEIFNFDLAFSFYDKTFDKKRFSLKDNTSEEIKDIVLELESKVNNKWIEIPEDKNLKEKFINIFQNNSISHRWTALPNGKIHNKILGSYSTNFLRKNKNWIY